MAQRKDLPRTPTEGGGNSKSAGKGGGKSTAMSAKTAAPHRNATTRREKASLSGRGRGETSVADHG